jgi:dTMP kinase
VSAPARDATPTPSRRATESSPRTSLLESLGGAASPPGPLRKRPVESAPRGDSVLANPPTTSGALITVEGVDGAGKSTQIALLARHLRARGCEVVTTREPGATPLGREVRRLVLESEIALEPLAELLLFLADRVEHVRRVIVPALAAGAIVLCDRFSDSTIAYQGYGRAGDVARVRRWDEESRDGVTADLTLLLDCPVPVAAARLPQATDRYQALEAAFHERVRAGFLTLADADPRRVRRIDASEDIARVRDEITAVVDSWLTERSR